MVICLEQGADLHMVQLMPLSLASAKSRLVFTFLVVAHLGSPEKRAVKRVCVCSITYFSKVLLPRSSGCHQNGTIIIVSGPLWNEMA